MSRSARASSVRSARRERARCSQRPGSEAAALIVRAKAARNDGADHGEAAGNSLDILIIAQAPFMRNTRVVRYISCNDAAMTNEFPRASDRIS
jgi:hypothetical protein